MGGGQRVSTCGHGLNPALSTDTTKNPPSAERGSGALLKVCGMLIMVIIGASVLCCTVKHLDITSRQITRMYGRYTKRISGVNVFRRTDETCTGLVAATSDADTGPLAIASPMVVSE